MPTQETMDVIEESLDAVERIPKVRLNGTTKKQQLIILGVTALAGALAGGGAAHFLTKRSLKTKYEELAEREIEEARAFYAALNNKPDPEALAGGKLPYTAPKIERAVEALEQYTSDAARGETEGTRVIKDVRVHSVSLDTTKNIFSGTAPADDDFDLEREMLTRTETEPYIISHDEFFTGEKDYQQTHLSYFSEDDTLVDDKEKPIDDTDAVVGDDTLTKFGYGSKDQNVVYVRNDRIEIDFEIVRSDGSYKREVLGFIEHSQRPGRGRRRGLDEE